MIPGREHRAATIAATLALTVAASCLSPGGVEVDCGPLDPAECDARARLVGSEAPKRRPGMPVAKITFTSADGAYVVQYADGSGYAVQ